MKKRIKGIGFLLAAAVAAVSIFIACSEDEIILVDKNIESGIVSAKSEYRVAYNDTIPFSITMEKDANNNVMGYVPEVRIIVVGANGRVFYFDDSGVKHDYFTNFPFECAALDTLGRLDMNLAVTSYSKTASRFSIISEVKYGDRISKDTVYVNINATEKFVMDVTADKDTVEVNSPVHVRLFVNNTEGEGHTFVVSGFRDSETSGEGTFNMSFPQMMSNNSVLEFDYTPTEIGQHNLIFTVSDEQSKQSLSSTLTLTATSGGMSFYIDGANTCDIKAKGASATASVKVTSSEKMFFAWEAVKGGGSVKVNNISLAEKTDRSLEKGDYHISLDVVPTSVFENEYLLTLRDELGRKQTCIFYVYRYAIVEVGGSYSDNATGTGAFRKGEHCNVSLQYNTNASTLNGWKDANGNPVSPYFDVTGDITLYPQLSPKSYTVTLCSGSFPMASEIFVKKPGETSYSSLSGYDLKNNSYKIGTFEYGTQIQIYTSAQQTSCVTYPGGTCSYFYWYRSDDRTYPISKPAEHTFRITEKVEKGCYYFGQSNAYPNSSDIKQRTDAY